MAQIDKQNSQSGQALVEYILIIGISVSLIVGLMNQLYKPFGAWLDNYMGQYLECLLDVGELPSFGSDLVSGECNSKFESFSVTGGRSPKPNSAGKDSANSSRSGNSNSRSSSNSDSSSNSGANANRSGSRRGGGDPFSTGRPVGSDSSGKGNGDGTLTEKLPETNYMKFRRGSATTIVNSERGARGPTESMFLVDKKKAKEEDSFAKKGTVIVEEQAANAKPKKLLVTPAERKPSSEEDDQPWSVSDYLRYGLIILIIIAILLFLIGQAAQISKSMEKNN